MGRGCVEYDFEGKNFHENEVWILVVFYFITLAADTLYIQDAGIQEMVRDWRPSVLSNRLGGLIVISLKKYLIDEHRKKAFLQLLDEAEKEMRKFEKTGLTTEYLKRNLEIPGIEWTSDTRPIEGLLEVLQKIRDLL